MPRCPARARRPLPKSCVLAIGESGEKLSKPLLACLKTKPLPCSAWGEKEEALRTLSQAIEQMLRGDTIDFNDYELLRIAPRPPQGIEEMIAMLKSAARD